MTSRVIHNCARGGLSIDTSDSPRPGVAAIPEPSQELLDRALVGWERFLRTTGEELSHE
ncbi:MULTISPECIES: hypothetical protein [unclassified Streptomyces]|uniref:hypothetical protein n=1 Tax=unclassified Streptomyces TaxID=2593676 RepID=UPI002E2BD677|nr:hypothetical protein [Streptomyces sp. NBC_01439]